MSVCLCIMSTFVFKCWQYFKLVLCINLTLILSDFQKICSTIENDEALRKAEEREKEISVNDEEMAERSVHSCTVMLVCIVFGQFQQSDEASLFHTWLVNKKVITDHFCGPGRATCPVCVFVSVCLDFKLLN